MNPAAEAHPVTRWLGAADLSLCLLLNRGVGRCRIRRLFAVVSRLGNGVFWYTLMAILALTGGTEGLQAVFQMALVGLAGLLIYKAIKRRVVRERPFITHVAIRLGAPPLDRHSFPSGHTMHAVAFTLVATAWFPQLTVVLVPFTVLVALSRMVLGLHYPSDVLFGAAIGFTLAQLSFTLFPFAG